MGVQCEKHHDSGPTLSVNIVEYFNIVAGGSEKIRVNQSFTVNSTSCWPERNGALHPVMLRGAHLLLCVFVIALCWEGIGFSSSIWANSD